MDIYGIYDDAGNLKYIGQSQNAAKRVDGHWRARNSLHSKVYLWLRTLDEPPPWRLLLIVEEAEASPVERACIIAARKMTNGALLNVKVRGYVSAETRAKMAAGNRGKVRSAEARANMSAARKGRKLSPEQVEKMRAATAARWADPEKRAALLAAQRSEAGRSNRSAAHQGKPHTEETKAKLAASKRAQWEDPEYRAKTTQAHIGRSVSPETRARQSAAAAAAWARRKAKPP